MNDRMIPVKGVTAHPRTGDRILRRLAASAWIAIVLACAGCSGVAQYIANWQYGEIDVPIDRETAVTVASYQPSPDIRAVIGGRGEGLDCSIPTILEALMFDASPGVESPISLQFRQACVFHDYCYRHGYATYGYAQADCDSILLQQAFRTCVQIYEAGYILSGQTYARGSTTSKCQSRAREVLLGVRLGGVGSFKAGEHSSYFEFDPMPMRADDYAVARLTRVDPATAPIVDGRALLSTPTTLHFKQGRVKSRQLRWNASKRLGDQDVYAEGPFPPDAVATPPYVARAGGRDWYIWLNRGSPYTTGFNVLTWFPGRQSGSAIFQPLPCPLTRTGDPCDFDASVIRVVQAPDATREAVGFLALTHRFADKTDGANRYEAGTIGLHRWEMPLAAFEGKRVVAPAASASKLARVSHRYRYLQSEPQVGEFRRPGCSEVIAFGRGIVLDAKHASDIPRSSLGDDFASQAAAGFIPLAGDCLAADSRQIELPQTTEPAVVVSKAMRTPDRLLTVKSAGEEATVRLTEYAFGESGAGKHNAIVQIFAQEDSKPVPLDGTWVKSAVYVVRGAEGDRLFFSRVKLDPSQKKRYDDGDAPESISIQFRQFGASDAGWVEEGYSSCEIDLEKQHKHRSSSVLYNLNYRLAFEGISERKEPDKWRQAQELFTRLYKRGLARRWMQSQVIPGYIFANDTQAARRPIDVAVIFHGSADYSLLLEGVSAGSGGQDWLEARQPAGNFAFASCKR